jgi:DNA invertase Pin-like site-specific DNA recombinase
MPPHSTDRPPTAYSYIRFSTPAQAEGDSLRRQVELAQAYCRRRGWTLDTTLTLRDLGVSAFRGDNALVGNLGVFLDAVKRGTVTAGSALIVESVDRISRQGIDEGYDLCKRILKAGVHIVTLSPERDFGPDAVKSLSKGALELQLILERAAEESEMKSRRLRAAWEEKRKRARQSGEVLTHRLPSWVEERDGKLCLIPDRAATLRKICQLATDGYGLGHIVQWLEREGIEPWGKSWNRPTLGRILKGRQIVGEFQSSDTERKPLGPTMTNYLPAVLSEGEWLAMRAGMGQRRTKPGRANRDRLNLFAGLLKGAHDQQPYHVITREHGVGPDGRRTRAPMLMASAAANYRGPARSFPLEVFEEAVLECLREVNPHEILNGDSGPDETLGLATQLAGVETELADAQAFMEANGFNEIIGKRIMDLDAKKRALGAQLADARQKAAHPQSEAWGEVQSLAAALKKCPDPADARLRLRAALRRITEGIWVLVVPRGDTRICAVQIWFSGGNKRRDYLILYRPRRANGQGSRQPARAGVLSLAEVTDAGALDLRRRDHAKRLERVLLEMDLPTEVEPGNGRSV